MDFPLFVYVFSSGVARLLDTRDQQSKRPPLTYYELKDHNYLLFFYHGSTAPSGPGTPHYRGFTITLRHTTFDRTPLDEWSARRRDLYLTTHSTHNRQTSMPPVGFEPTISAGERPQTYAFDRAATGTGIIIYWKIKYLFYRPFVASWTLLPGGRHTIRPTLATPLVLTHSLP